jgi:hypothetical protein
VNQRLSHSDSYKGKSNAATAQVGSHFLSAGAALQELARFAAETQRSDPPHPAGRCFPFGRVLA